MRTTKVSLLILAVLPLATGSAAAATYKWVDAEGNTHYADQPVQGAAQVDVKAPGPAPDAAAPTDPGLRSDEQIATDVRAQECGKAQKRLADYQKADTLVQVDAEGKKTEMSADQRVQTIVKAQRDVKDYCGPAPVQASTPAPTQTPPAASEAAAASAAPGGSSTAPY